MLRTFSVLMLTLLLASMLTLAFDIQPVKASGTIYIRADGSIDPSTAPISTVDNATYILTGNITIGGDGVAIEIERDNIIFDGTGYTIQGTGTGKGIALGARSNVTIRNVVVKKFFLGIELIRSTNNTICGNELTANNGEGIWLYDSSEDCSIHGNHVTNNSVLARNISCV